MDLVQQPRDAVSWHGPYLDQIPKDPWNNDYIYDCPGKHNPSSYDISSLGPPGDKCPSATGPWTGSKLMQTRRLIMTARRAQARRPKRQVRGRSVPRPSAFGAPSGFTLIELILVMAILTMAVSMTAPTLSRFFRGRTLDSEARRLLALTRNGQSRAVSEGLPMDLWVDPEQGKFGLEAEPSYDNNDPRKVDLELDTGLQIRIEMGAVSASTNSGNAGQVASVASIPRTLLVQPGLPTIRFMPDGSIADTSPQMLCLAGRDGFALWLKQTRNRLTYEIKS